MGAARVDGASRLSEWLADGPRESQALHVLARAEGITPKMLRVARERLGVVIRRSGNGVRMRSTWSLPVESQKARGRPLAVSMRGMEQPTGEPSDAAGLSFADAERGRISRRIAFFMWKGLTKVAAHELAIHLLLERDRHGSRAGSCIECQNWRPEGQRPCSEGQRQPGEIWDCSWRRHDAP